MTFVSWSDIEKYLELKEELLGIPRLEKDRDLLYEKIHIAYCLGKIEKAKELIKQRNKVIDELIQKRAEFRKVKELAIKKFVEQFDEWLGLSERNG